MIGFFLAEGEDWYWIVGGLIGALIVFVLALVLIKFAAIWVQAYMSKANITLLDLIGMSLRKVRSRVIVTAKIMAVQAGIEMETRDLEAHYLAGGNVPNVVMAMIASDRAGLDLDFKTARGIDLAGRDVLEAVRTCVNPKVIDCPDPAKGSGCGMRGWAIQLSTTLMLAGSSM